MFRGVSRSGLLPVLLFSILGFFTMGYHPGAEDDGVYLAAVKARLNPALFPHDALFFNLQMRASVFDNWMAHFIRASGLSIAGAELLWQFISIVLILWACWNILCRLFDDTAVRWAGTAAVSAMLTLPVAGTALYIADPYLHPRNIATGLILLAVARILHARRLQALPLLAGAMLLHPMMGAFGVSFCLILSLTLHTPFPQRIQAWRGRLAQRQAAAPVAALVPLGWIFEPPSSAWVEAMRSRHWFWLYQWSWYEWLGALGPLILFWLTARVAARRGEHALARFATAVLLYGVFQQFVAFIVCGQQSRLALATLEPMRFLHLVYVFMVLIAGALLGRHVLRERIVRWAVFLLLANGAMYAAQRQLFSATPHIEFPGPSANPWLQAFDWVHMNTSQDAYFALGPRYMAEPGEDMHSFRALAERSTLADAIKDGSVVSKAPELARVWQSQVAAQNGWKSFRLSDFERLRTAFGVDWVLVDFPPPHGLPCPWHNPRLSVCRIP